MSRSLGATSLTTRSPIRSVPSLISSRPAIIRRLVVLPQPEGPTRTMNSPSAMARFRSSTASTSPYFLVTWSKVTVAMCAPPPHRDIAGPCIQPPFRGVDGPRTRSRLGQFGSYHRNRAIPRCILVPPRGERGRFQGMVDDRRPDDAGLPPDPTTASDAAPAEPPAQAEPVTPAAPDAPPEVTPLVAWAAPPPEPGPWQYDAPPGWTGLDVMSVFGRTVDTFIAHWQTFVALSLPSVLVSLISLVVASSRSGTATAVQPIDFLALLYIPIGIYVTTSIAMATDDVHAGRPVSALAVLGPAVGRAAVAFLSVIVVALAMVGLLFIPLILFSAAVLAGGVAGAAIGVVI